MQKLELLTFDPHVRCFHLKHTSPAAARPLHTTPRSTSSCAGRKGENTFRQKTGRLDSRSVFSLTGFYSAKAHLCSDSVTIQRPTQDPNADQTRGQREWNAKMIISRRDKGSNLAKANVKYKTETFNPQTLDDMAGTSASTGN